MRKMARTLARAATVASVVALLAPAMASAQMREFSGKVDRISKSKIYVDNRMGDKLAFERLDDTAVEGEKSTWEDIQTNDWVSVSWKIIDKPRKAYKVTVLPPKPEPGEDE